MRKNTKYVYNCNWTKWYKIHVWLQCLAPPYINTFCENVKFNLQTVGCDEAHRGCRGEEVTDPWVKCSQIQGFILESQFQWKKNKNIRVKIASCFVNQDRSDSSFEHVWFICSCLLSADCTLGAARGFGEADPLSEL